MTRHGVRLSLTAVRYATRGDLDQLTELEREADEQFRPLWTGSGQAWERWPDPTPGADRAATPGFVLAAGDPLLGFAHVLDRTGSGGRDEDGPERGGRVRMHLDQIAVRPSAQGRGVGEMLLRAAMGAALDRGAAELTLMTYADVPWNGPWYARQGFVEVTEESHPDLWAELEHFRAVEDGLGLPAAGRRIAMAVPLADEPTPLPAVSVIPVRERDGVLEVFVQHRAHTMDFVPGAVVFPGGRVDPQDSTTAERLGIDVTQACGVREVAEETGAVIDPADLVPWDRWITPIGYPKRFDVFFYVLPVADGAEFAHTTGEAVRSEWTPVRDLVVAVESGDLAMVAPTRTIVDELSALGSLSAVVGLSPDVGPVDHDLAAPRPRRARFAP
ncbi:MAG: GNAT family N-acetyltransferase [Intrasporangiaceae bacterium]|nr:GNAT family N-acetyltransferase [Intrasporangiaceae bacterium]